MRKKGGSRPRRGRLLPICLGRKGPVTVPRGQERGFFLNGNNLPICNWDAEGRLSLGRPPLNHGTAGVYLFPASVYS